MFTFIRRPGGCPGPPHPSAATPFGLTAFSLTHFGLTPLRHHSLWPHPLPPLHPLAAPLGPQTLRSHTFWPHPSVLTPFGRTPSPPTPFSPHILWPHPLRPSPRLASLPSAPTPLTPFLGSHTLRPPHLLASPSSDHILKPSHPWVPTPHFTFCPPRQGVIFFFLSEGAFMSGNAKFW